MARNSVDIMQSRHLELRDLCSQVIKPSPAERLALRMVGFGFLLLDWDRKRLAHYFGEYWVLGAWLLKSIDIAQERLENVEAQR